MVMHCLRDKGRPARTVVIYRGNRIVWSEGVLYYEETVEDEKGFRRGREVMWPGR